MRLAPGIVTAMQQLALEQRRLLGPRAAWHVGDIAWNARQHEGREDEWRIRLWVEDGRTVAWSWLQRDGTLEHDVHPEHLHLLDEILAEPRARTAAAFADDAGQREALARHGFADPGYAMHYLSRDLPAAPTPPPLPDGFRYRSAGAADVPARVAIHGAVWSRPEAPSRVTESSFAQVRAQWPYRESLDCVIEAGRLVRRLLPVLARRRERGRRVRARRRPPRVPQARTRRGRLHVRPAASVRGGRAPGDRLLRVRRGLRPLPVPRLPHPRDAGRIRPPGLSPIQPALRGV